MTYDILIRMKKNPQYLTLHIKTNEAIMKNSWENLSCSDQKLSSSTLLQVRFFPINFLDRTTSANIFRKQSSEGCLEHNESVSSLMTKVRADLP